MISLLSDSEAYMETKQLIEKAAIQLKKELKDCSLTVMPSKILNTTDYLEIISAIIQLSDWKEEKKVASIVATMLVQLSLDVHDQINNNQIDQYQHSRIILQGDILSSRYYMLLALYDEIALIKQFALAIKRINSWKMWLTDLNAGELNRYVKTKIKIETEVINCLARYFSLQQFENCFTSFYLYLFWQNEHHLFKKSIKSECAKIYQQGCSKQGQLQPYHIWVNYHLNLSRTTLEHKLIDQQQDLPLFYNVMTAKFATYQNHTESDLGAML